MNYNSKLITLFFICLFALINSTCVHGATIWCNPQNQRTETGMNKQEGFRTLHNALDKMTPGDTLIIANGDWRKKSGMFMDHKHHPPAGIELKYSKILAETDWNVQLPYVRLREGQSFAEIRGIVFDNRYIGYGMSHVSLNVNHIKFIRCGFLCHGLKSNSHTCGFGSDDKFRSKNKYNLMEECIAWGSGRYVFYCKYGKYNIFRRCVARHDISDKAQMFNFRAYACDYTIYQNCISIDSDRTEYYAKPINIETGGFWIGDQYGAIGNIVDGCISIKDIQIAYYIGGSGKNLGAALVRNCVALDMSYKLPKANTLCAFVVAQNENVTIKNFTGVGAKLRGYDGIYCKKRGKKDIENCIIANVSDEGIGINPSSEEVKIRNIVSYNVGSDRHIKGFKNFDPFKNGLMYPIRIEPGSKLATMGHDKTVCGATILKKIGVSGTLYGDPGWDKVTDEKLWPFPNEDKVREHMRKTVDDVRGEYGFCTDGQTLTNYIWGYLGNTVPPFNLQAVPSDGSVTLTWNPPPETARKTITGYNVYRISYKIRALQGGTVIGSNNCTKTIAGLQNGKSYEFAVTALDREKGESGLSYKVQVIPGKVGNKSAGKESATVTTYPKESKGEPAKDKNQMFSNKFGIEFMPIQAGGFNMGIVSESQTKTRFVTIKKTFYMQKTEVTQRHWKRIMGTNPSFYKKYGPDCPLEQVSWYEAQEFIEKLNELEGRGTYRLPTEAEWEYSCRAGTETPFSFGECLSSKQANYNGNHPHGKCPEGPYIKRPVGAFAFEPNAWGLVGMHGNVWEWCQDWLSELGSNPVADPKGPPSGTMKVIRGGGWNSYANACRSGNRSGVTPKGRYGNLGFRLVFEP
jgi:formylglycine-generating enzyme required for sulfatase activity